MLCTRPLTEPASSQPTGARRAEVRRRVPTPPPDENGMIQLRVDGARSGVRTRPLLFAGAVVAIIVGFLALDQLASARDQLLIGAATWVALLAACVPLTPEGRARVLIVVIVATCAEILGSIVIGAYEYRLGTCRRSYPRATASCTSPGLRISQCERCAGTGAPFSGS